jgi:hypothetical protein
MTPTTYDTAYAHYVRTYGTSRLGRWFARRDARTSPYVPTTVR